MMVAQTRKYFHTFENYQLYLNEWPSIMLKNVISANSKKDLIWCLEFVITKLQKLHQALKYNYDSSKGTFAGQLISAC
jgi:hypothetical protein